MSVVAHRVVHGGEKFTEATLLTDELVAEMEKLNPLAPLHNPVIIAGIREMRKLREHLSITVGAGVCFQ